MAMMKEISCLNDCCDVGDIGNGLNVQIAWLQSSCTEKEMVIERSAMAISHELAVLMNVVASTLFFLMGVLGDWRLFIEF